MPTNNAINLKTQGTCYYNGTGTFSGVDASTAGFVYTSNGTGVAPSFQAAAGGSSASLSPYIVGTTGTSDFSTIVAAIAQAVSDGASNSTPRNIYVKPGTYSGSFTVSPGINIIGMDQNAGLYGYPESVVVTGNVTIAGSANCKLQNLSLKPTSGNIITITATGSNILLSNCVLDAGTAHLSALSNSASFTLINCWLNSGLFTLSANDKNYAFNCQNCYFIEQGSTFGATSGNTVSIFFDSGTITSMNISSVGATSPTTSIRIDSSYISTGGPLGASDAAGSYTASISNCDTALNTDIFSFGSTSHLVFITDSKTSFSGTPTAATGRVFAWPMSDSSGNEYIGPALILGPTYAGTGPSFTSYPGDPNGVLTANIGSYCANTSPTGPTDRGWINTDNGTTWQGVLTVL